MSQKPNKDNIEGQELDNAIKRKFIVFTVVMVVGPRTLTALE